MRQKKTGQPVRFEMTEHTREAVDSYIEAADKKPGEFLFAGRGGRDRPITTRQYSPPNLPMDCQHRARPEQFFQTPLRPNQGDIIYRHTGNLRAVQLLLGHKKIESMVRYLGIEVDDALAIAEQVDV